MTLSSLGRPCQILAGSGGFLQGCYWPSHSKEIQWYFTSNSEHSNVSIKQMKIWICHRNGIFGTRLGKSPSDGAKGVVKWKVEVHPAVVRNAEFGYGQMNMPVHEGPVYGAFLRVKDSEMSTSLKVKFAHGTLKSYWVSGMEEPMRIKTRNLAWFLTTAC